MRALRIPLALFATLLASALFADETWLAPNQGYIAPGLGVRFDLTSGARFPILETAIEPARLSRFGVRLGVEVGKPTFTSGPRSLKFAWTSSKDKEGYATAYAVLRAKKLTLTPDLVAEYLEGIGQTGAFLEKWRARPEPRAWREESRKHAKAFFRVGKTTGEAYREPIGLDLEIVPQSDPTRGNPNEDFVVQVLRGGNPVTGFTLIALIDANTPRTFALTDASGKATFRLARPGRWLIEGVDLRESTKPGLDYESDFTSMLVTVVPAPKVDASPSPSPAASPVR